MLSAVLRKDTRMMEVVIPRVSVVIPVFNGATTVARAVDSALVQDFEGFEVIVVDDGSSDSTPEALEHYGDRVRIIRQRKQGPPIARITGSAAARGEYLAFLDADDVWLQSKLRKTVALLDRNPESVLAFSNLVPVDYFGRPTGELYVADSVARPPTMDDLLRQLWPILPSAAVIRRASFEKCAGPYSEFNKRGYEDCYLWLLARERGAFSYTPEPLVIYRQPPLLERLQKYREGFDLFVRLVERRYGIAGRKLAEEANKAYASTLGHQGLLAMARDERHIARKYFVCALYFRAFRVRNFLRLTRAFLPRSLVIPLTGRTRVAFQQPRLRNFGG